MTRMTRLALFAALALATVPLGACAGGQAPSAPAVDLSQTAIDEKALYAAEALYNVPAQAYVDADARGKLTPEMKAVLKPKLADAYKALLAIRVAYEIGNETMFVNKLATLGELSASILSLTPK
jgi:hypothetical protein